MAASLTSSAYFPTRPVLGSQSLRLTIKATESLDSSAELAVAESLALTSRKEEDLEVALSKAEKALEGGSPGDQAMVQLVLANIYFKKGCPQEAHQAADAASKGFAELKDKAGQAKAFHAKALAYNLVDDDSRAVKYAQKALALYKDMGNQKCQAFELLVIAHWQISSKKPYASLQSGKQARALAREADDAALEAAAVLVMCESYVHRGGSAEAIKIANEFKAAQEAKGQEPGITCGHCIVLYALISSADPLDALDHARSANAFAESLSDSKLKIDIKYMKFQAELRNKNAEEAAMTVRGAASLAQDLGDQAEEADALRMVSFALSNVEGLGTETVLLDEAIEAASEAKGLYKSCACKSGEASAQMMLAVLNSHKEGDFDLVSMVEEARGLYGDASDAAGEHSALTLLAEMHVDAKRYTSALEYANNSVDLWTTAGSKKAQADAMQAVANIYVMMEDYEEAEAQVEEAQALAREVGAKRLDASLSILLTKVYLEEGAKSPDQAQELRVAAMSSSDMALSLAGQTGEKDLWAIALSWRSQVLSWTGRADEALTTADKSEKAFREVGDLLNQVRAMIKIAELFKLMGKKKDAKEKATEALEFAKEHPECASAEAEAQQLITSMEEKKVVRSGGGGKRMVRKLVKKWRKKDGSGGGGGTVSKGLDAGATSKKLLDLVKNVIADDDEELHDDTPFMDAGIDSLGSVQLVTDCSKAFQMSLAPSVIFDFPTIRALSDHLVQESMG